MFKSKIVYPPAPPEPVQATIPEEALALRPEEQPPRRPDSIFGPATQSS